MVRRFWYYNMKQFNEENEEYNINTFARIILVLKELFFSNDGIHFMKVRFLSLKIIIG